MITRDFIDDLAEKLELKTEGRKNGGISVKGSLSALRGFARVCMARKALYPTIITEETIDGVHTLEAPRIDIHPQAIKPSGSPS